MTTSAHKKPAPFGALLGMAPGNVAVYSSDYDSADETQLPDRRAYRNYLDNIYMGYKWQCVEFARRWMYLNKGWIFDDVAMAYDIFRLRKIHDLRNKRQLPLHGFRNGSRRLPEPGCMLIWEEGGEFARTGHVAIVTEVFPERLRLVEQNVRNYRWPEGQNYSREIPARMSDDQGYWLRCSFTDANILGWVIQTDDASHAEDQNSRDPRLLEIRSHQAPLTENARLSWLNIANPDEAAYVEMMGGHYLAANPDYRDLYCTVSETAIEELKRATNELHALYMHATDHVLRDDRRLAKFNIPAAIWPRIHQSWNNRRNQVITGRFDFCLSAEGLKVYEYNCDSASCHMETGKVQGKWARHRGSEIGENPGARLLGRLVDAWRHSAVDGILHILVDDNLEEIYHALFMKEALEAADIECRIIQGLEALSWSDSGDIIDTEGHAVRWVWKTWAWETALDQLRAECEQDSKIPESLSQARINNPKPRLVDVLLRPEVMVFEPLWTLIPSNKAILPVLWELFGDQDYLLNTAYELSDEIRARGYVQKPIVGRCGDNISLYDAQDRLIAETGGRFDSPHQVFQELCPLPVVNGQRVQLCSFSAGGTYAGACVRVDPSPVIKSASDVVALRMVPDEYFLSTGQQGRGVAPEGPARPRGRATIP